MSNQRQNFPIFERRPSLHYLDTAATAQKPVQVMDAMREFAFSDYANVHRGVSKLNEAAEVRYAEVRSKIANFLGVGPKNIVITNGATHAINLLAESYGKSFLKEGDEVLLSHLEHHSNILPWQRQAQERGIKLRYVSLNLNGSLSMESFREQLNSNTKLIALNHMSNVLGQVIQAHEVVNQAHSAGVPVMLDGCQMVPHHKVNLLELEADFYVFSSHKIYGPTGVGALYIADPYMHQMQPAYSLGGGIVSRVTEFDADFIDPPEVFEAGTPPIMEAVGFGAALDYINDIGYEKIESIESDLSKYAIERLKDFRNLTMHGDGPVISLIHSQIHPHDLATIASNHSFVVARAGHHCCQLLMDAMNWNATFRISFGVYNEFSDVDALVSSIVEAERIFC